MRVDRYLQSRLSFRSTLVSFPQTLRGWASRREVGLLALLLALALARGVVYSAVIPPWQVHDEPYHFYSAWIPLLPPAPQQDEAWRNLQTEIASSMIQLRFWDYTPFEQSPQNAQEEHARLEAAIRTRRPAEPRAFTYYLLSAALYPAQHQDVVLQLYWARLWSVVVNIGIIFLAVWAGKMLFRDDPFSRWLLPLLIVFHPQHTFILAGVNDGGIAELFASAAVLAIIALLLRGWRWTWFGLAVVCTALAAAAKPPGAYLVPIVVLMTAIYAWQKLRGYWRWIGFVVGLAVLVGVVLAVPRIFIKIRLLETYFNRVGPEEFFVSIITTSASRGFLWAFRSWWAFLGWESLPVSDEWMWTLLVLTGASVIGWGIFVWRYIRDRASVPEDRPIWRVFWMFVLMLVMLGMLVVLQGTVWNEDTFVGRYFFVAMLPTVGLIVLGWREIIPHHWRLEALAAFTVFLFLFDAAVLLAHVVPFFYPLWR